MTLALPCRLNPIARSIRATVRSETGCPPPVNASARFRVDFVVHTSSDIGSPRVSGSTSVVSSATSPGSDSASLLRPPPGARTRTDGSGSPVQLPNPTRHGVRVHPGRLRDRLDPAPAQLPRLRPQHQAALPLIQMRTQHRILSSDRLRELRLLAIAQP